jgi:membrane protease YdiL (CAAX protease family)
MRSLVKFFFLTYVVSWACFIAAATSPRLPAIAGLRGPLFLLGAFAPAIVAIGLTGRAEGRAGLLGLLTRILRWRVDLRWYLFALTYMATIKLAVALIYRLATGAWPRFGQDAWYIILVAILISTPVQAGEEVGWRGYALPRLAARLGLARASIVLGVIWACWHLPFFFIPGIDKSGQSFPVYLVQVTALSVAAAWLYWRTSQSLLLVMLLHSAVNQTIGFVPSTVTNASNPFALSTSLVAWLTVALLSTCAAYFLVRMSRTDLHEGWQTATDLPEVPPGKPCAPQDGGAQPLVGP